LCFDRGITLVISPLISLMRDQVDALVRRRVKAASWDRYVQTAWIPNGRLKTFRVQSTLSASQVKIVKDGILNGDLKLLYVAPEK
jgi:superfamily II DNA helicase RecQ